MLGSLYPDGVTVDHIALRRTETTKAAEILRNRLDWTSRGILYGGVVSVNTFGPGPYTHIDVTQFGGFAPNGEYLESDSDYFDIALSDETSGVVNYVLAIYTENNTHSQPHESDQHTYPIFSEMGWRLRVYTEAEFLALAATDDNLANDAQDRCMILAKVTANGPASDLTASSIQHPLEFNNILYATPRALTTILGVDVLAVSPDTPVGDGTLEYDYTAPSTYDFTWTTSNGAGATQTISADATIDVPDGAGEYIRISVATSVLPTSGTFPMTETITISNLYYQDIPRLTGEDSLHRNMLGTGVLSPTNPHALSLDDITGESFSLLDEHQNLMHCNGISWISQPNFLSVSIDETQTPDTYTVVGAVGGDTYYVNGQKLTTVEPTSAVTITPPTDKSAYLYEVLVTDEGDMIHEMKAAFPGSPSGHSRNVTGCWIVDMSDNYPSGSATLEVQCTGGAPWTFIWDGGKPVTVTSVAVPPQAIRLYAADGVHWIDLWVNPTFSAVASDEFLPLANASDTITIFASLTDGTDEYMHIASLVYYYEPTGPSWVLGYNPLSSSRNSVDKRHWGNTCKRNMADSALQDLIYSPNNELGRSGCVMRRNGVYNEFGYDYGGTGFGIDINGGAYYCRGQRIVADSVQTVSALPSTSQFVWADMEGNYHVLDITGGYGGDVSAAMRYVLGLTENIPNVSDTYHFSGPGDPPERGVLLYYLATDSTDITRIVDFTQNVNHVTDPWSVASRIATSVAHHGQAAYDNLFAAFEYARHAMSGTENLGAHWINIIGSVTIDFPVWQPQYVNVRGVKGLSVSPVGAVVQCNVAADYNWHVQQGCVVEGVNIVNNDATSITFAAGSLTTIRDCYHFSTGAPFVAWELLVIGETSVNNVTIENNVSIGCPFIFGAGLKADGMTSWSVRNNRIYSVPSIYPIAISLFDVADLHLEGNYIEVPDTNDSAIGAGILVQNTSSSSIDTRDIYIRDNTIRIGNNGAQLNSPTGIIVDQLFSVHIEGNNVDRHSGSSTQIITGVLLLDGGGISVTGNAFSYLGGGVLLEGACYGVEISRNTMTYLYHLGVRANINSFPVLNTAGVLKIDGNFMTAFVKGTSSGHYLSSELTGVIVECDLTVTEPDLSMISVSENLMGGLSSEGSVRGIRITLDHTSSGGDHTRGLTVDANILYGLRSSGNSTRGIYISGTSYVVGTQGIQGATINDNVVILPGMSTTSFRVAGIDVDHALADSAVSGNTVILNGDNSSNGAALYMGSTSSSDRVPINCTVSGNVLSGLRAGFFGKIANQVSVNNNYIYGNGTGIYAATSTPLSLISDNVVVAAAYNGNPYSSLGGGSGSHCVVYGDDCAGVSLSGNKMLLQPIFNGSTLDVPAGSACIKARDCANVTIDGCLLTTRAGPGGGVQTVAGTNGSSTYGYLCYLRMPTSYPSQYSIKGCVFDDTDSVFTGVPTPLHALYILPASGWDAANGEYPLVHVEGNTFYTTCTSTSAFNWEGNSGAVSANHPYVMHVQSLLNTGGAGRLPEFFFNGNAIHVVASVSLLSDTPKVYLAKSGGWPSNYYGGCFYETLTFTNFTSYNGGTPPIYTWV